MPLRERLLQKVACRMQQQRVMNQVITGSINSVKDCDRNNYLDRIVLLRVTFNAARKAGPAVEQNG